MQLTRKYSINIHALLLLTVFLFAWLVKPMHILIEHHNFEQVTPFHSDNDLLVPDRHFDCQICEFEFCTFLSTDRTTLPVADFRLTQIDSDKATHQPLQVLSYRKLLRAPPTI
jgi:hypothetical protein